MIAKPPATPTITDISAPTSITEEFKEAYTKHNLSKFEYDLYHEEDDISLPVISIKRIGMPNNGEKWKIMNNNKLIFTIESNKISKKERAFLQTINGFNFILTRAKLGIKSLNNFKSALKKYLKAPTQNKKKISSK